MKYNIWLHSTTLSIISITSLIFLFAINTIYVIDAQKYDENLFNLILQSTTTLFSIIIALSIISLEHSASNHTSTILKLYMDDKFVRFVLSLNILFIIFIVLVINFELNCSFLVTTLFIYDIIVLFIYVFYMLHIINPIFIIKKIELNIVNEIKKRKSDILNEQIIANISINDKTLSNILKYELVLENIIYASHQKHDHELTNMSLTVHFNIIIICTEHAKIGLSSHDSFLKYLIRKFDQYVHYNIKNYDIVSASKIIEKGKNLAIHFIDKEYDDFETSPLYGIIYSMTDLAKKCLHNKIYSTFEIIENFGDIGEKSKNHNTEFLIYCVYDIAKEDNFKNITLCNHTIKHAMRILSVMTTIKTCNMIHKNFNYLSSIIEKIPDGNKNDIFYYQHFHNKSDSFILKYVDNTIMACKNNNMSYVRAQRNLLFLVDFLVTIQPKEYDEITSGLMYDLINNIKSKIINDDDLKNRFMPTIIQIDLCLNPIFSAVHHYQQIRDQHEYEQWYSSNN